MRSTSYLVIMVMIGIVCYYLMQNPSFDPELVRGKRVLLTGASSGIGEQLAYHYAQLGALLLLTARRLPLLQKVAARCHKLGAPQVDVVVADMAVAADRATVVRHAEDRLGGLDYLILNHALLRHGLWSGSTTNFSNLRMDVAVNFVSHVDLASKALPLLARSRGNIGVVSSGLGEIGAVMGTTYSTSKHALQGFFSSWRQELRHNNVPVSITLCVLGPVSTKTFLDIFAIEQKKPPSWILMSSPEDAANAVIRGTVARVYKFRHNWLIAFLLFLNDFVFQCEDAMNWYFLKL